MKIVEGELIPGVALGEFYIGMEKKQVMKQLSGDYTEGINLGEGYTQIVLENALMWFNRSEQLTQIGVTEGFKGVYKNVIGIVHKKFCDMRIWFCIVKRMWLQYKALSFL